MMRLDSLIAAAGCGLWIAVAALPASAQMADLPAEVGAAIGKMGPNLDGSVAAESVALMRPLQAPRTELVGAKDLAYGTDPLQTLDLYKPQQSAGGPVPIVVYVHGGGFRTGDKRGGENVAAYFARHGLVGVTISYRLSPAVAWPAQSLDLGAAVAWLKANAARYDGDARKIVVIGHSSGAAVVASTLLDHSIKTDRDGVVGAVLISGVYGYGDRINPYYGQDAKIAVEREPRSHTGEDAPPLLIVTAEFDPARIGASGLAFASALCVRDKKCPPFLWLSGHNHMTEIGSIDTKDDRLGETILDFVHRVTK